MIVLDRGLSRLFSDEKAEASIGVGGLSGGDVPIQVENPNLPPPEEQAAAEAAAAPAVPGAPMVIPVPAGGGMMNIGNAFADLPGGPVIPMVAGAAVLGLLLLR